MPQCADDCLGEESVQELTACIRLNLDCADICATTGRVVSRQTGYDAEVTSAVLRACIEACRSCADECEIHAAHAMEHCKICAEECRRCEQACQSCSPQSPEPGACDAVLERTTGLEPATFGLKLGFLAQLRSSGGSGRLGGCRPRSLRSGIAIPPI